jgi:hypothetical protein
MPRGISIDVKKFNEEAKALVQQLERWSTDIQKDAQKIVKPAAEFTAKKIAEKTPVFNKRHYRYSNGQKIAEYYPGNLRRSILNLDLRKVPGAIVGPKLGGSRGKFSGARVDGYYFRFVDRGAPARGIRPQRIRAKGAAAARQTAYRIIEKRLIQRLKTL